MLQIQTVEPNCLALLRELMSLEELKSFRLAGGTALSLHLGHRKSIDLDLFTNDFFEVTDLTTSLKLHFKERIIVKGNNKFGLFAEIDDVKVDFLFRYEKFIDPDADYDSLRLASLKDIAAMKILAASNRSDKKDYYDLNALSEIFSFEGIIAYFSVTYPNYSLAGIIKSLSNFQELDLENDPILLNDVSWETVKKNITLNVNNYVSSLQLKKLTADKERQKFIDEIVAKKKNK